MASMVAKLSTRSLGDPRKVVVNAPETENRWMMGTLIGKADGLSKRTSPDGEKVHEGLKGVFAAIPSDPKGEEQQSAVLYLPEGMAENFLAPFRGANPVAAMNIGIEVYIMRAKNPQGYSWELKPILAAEAKDDPLAELRKAIADKKAPAIEHKASGKK